MIDNYSIWEAHEAELENDLRRFPICGRCSEHITDDLFDINGFIYCCDCAESEFKRSAENYVLEN